MMVNAQCKSIVCYFNNAKRVRDEVNDTIDPQIDKKRKIEQIDGQHNDGIKSATTTDDGDDVASNKDPLELDAINNDCLRHIFEFLTLHDLINVAETSERFVFPAAEAFSRCFRKKKVEVMATSEPILKFMRLGFLRIDGDTAMTGLHYFGARMSTISANFDAFESIEDKCRHSIDEVILENCTDSLSTFDIHFCIESHFKTINKPFTKVKNLMLNGCILGEKFAQLRM